MKKIIFMLSIIIPTVALAEIAFDETSIHGKFRIDFSKSADIGNKETSAKMIAIAKDYAEKDVAKKNKAQFQSIVLSLNPVIGHTKYKNYFRFILKMENSATPLLCHAIASEKLDRYSAACYYTANQADWKE